MIVNSLNDEDKEEIAIYEDLQSRLPKGRGRFLEIEPPPPSPRSPARGPTSSARSEIYEWGSRKRRAWQNA